MVITFNTAWKYYYACTVLNFIFLQVRHLFHRVPYSFIAAVLTAENLQSFLSGWIIQRWEAQDKYVLYSGCQLNHNAVFIDINYVDLKFIMLFDKKKKIISANKNVPF